MIREIGRHDIKDLGSVLDGKETEASTAGLGDTSYPEGEFASMCFDERPCVVGEIAVDGEVSEKEIENVSDELSERDFGLHVSPVGDVGAG